MSRGKIVLSKLALGLIIPQLIVNYLTNHIKVVWLEIICSGIHANSRRITISDVEALATSAPGAIPSDRDAIYRKIFHSREVFRNFHREELPALWENVQRASRNGPIPSLETFFEDLKFIRGPLRCLRELVKIGPGQSLLKTLSSVFRSRRAEECIIQVSDTEVEVCRSTELDPVDLGIRQLFMCAMRLCAKPEAYDDPVVVGQIARLASAIGFTLPEIETLVRESSDSCIAESALCQARAPELYRYCQPSIEECKRKIVAIFRTAEEKETADTAHEHTTPRSATRCGVLPAEELARVRGCLFAKELHDFNGALDSPSLFFRRAVYLAFFGKPQSDHTDVMDSRRITLERCSDETSTESTQRPSLASPNPPCTFCMSEAQLRLQYEQELETKLQADRDDLQRQYGSSMTSLQSEVVRLKTELNSEVAERTKQSSCQEKIEIECRSALTCLQDLNIELYKLQLPVGDVDAEFSCEEEPHATVSQRLNLEAIQLQKRIVKLQKGMENAYREIEQTKHAAEQQDNFDKVCLQKDLFNAKQTIESLESTLKETQEQRNATSKSLEELKASESIITQERARLLSEHQEQQDLAAQRAQKAQEEYQATIKALEELESSKSEVITERDRLLSEHQEQQDLAAQTAQKAKEEYQATIKALEELESSKSESIKERDRLLNEHQKQQDLNGQTIQQLKLTVHQAQKKHNVTKKALEESKASELSMTSKRDCLVKEQRRLWKEAEEAKHKANMLGREKEAFLKQKSQFAAEYNSLQKKLESALGDQSKSSGNVPSTVTETSKRETNLRNPTERTQGLQRKYKDLQTYNKRLESEYGALIIRLEAGISKLQGLQWKAGIVDTKMQEKLSQITTLEIDVQKLEGTSQKVEEDNKALRDKSQHLEKAALASNTESTKQQQDISLLNDQISNLKKTNNDLEKEVQILQESLQEKKDWESQSLLKIMHLRNEANGKPLYLHDKAPPINMNFTGSSRNPYLTLGGSVQTPEKKRQKLKHTPFDKGKDAHFDDMSVTLPARQSPPTPEARSSASGSEESHNIKQAEGQYVTFIEDGRRTKVSECDVKKKAEGNYRTEGRSIFDTKGRELNPATCLIHVTQDKTREIIVRDTLRKRLRESDIPVT